MELVALCQDCLRLNPVHETNEGVCECGGDTCSCPDCVDTANMLLVGIRDYKRLGLINPITHWTADSGCV